MTFLVVACNGLSERVFDNRPSDGLIEYQITFPEISEESITGSLMPDKMFYHFTEDLFSSSFETVGGVFKNRVISDRIQKTVNHELKVFRKRIRSELNETQVLKMIADYPNMAVIHTDDIDTIAGFPCKKALIVFEDVDRPEIEVFYTNSIKMNSPNWCTQYHDIDGVLMAYEIEEFGIRMRLEATNIKPLPKENGLFDKTDEYTVISKEAMQIELEELVATFEL
jgi:hypothetical protein